MIPAVPHAAGLADIGVLVTRPAEQAGRLVARLQEMGARPLLFPALAIVGSNNPEALRAAFADIERFDWVVFISPTAAQFGLAALEKANPAALLRIKAAAVGSGTAAVLRAAGVRQVVVPAVGADSEHLLALLEFADLSGRRILILRGEGGRELIADTLRARGAQVEYAECYRRVCPSTDPTPLRLAVAQQQVQAITVFSRETLDNLLELLGEQADVARALPIFAPHRRIAQHALAQGFSKAVETAPGEDGVLAGLVEYFAHE